MPLQEAQVTTEACYFRVKSSPTQRWHRVLKFYPGPVRAHISYCGKIRGVSQSKVQYAGEYNNSDPDILKNWRDCKNCDYYYQALVRSPAP